MRLIFLSLILSLSVTLHADTRDNAIALFDWAESSFPELLRPAAPEVQEIQGFFVRHYTDTDIYLGVQGDNIWAFGAQLGPDIIYVGKLDDLITISERDITDEIFTSRRGVCAYYAEPLFASVLDIRRNILFSSTLAITVDDNSCVFTSNNIPNHDFNDNSAAFADDVAEVTTELRIPIEPRFADTTTAISLLTDNAVFLNGVKLDLLAAACYNVADEKIGCNDINQPWRFDPMSPQNNFGTDMHNAHTQPGGAYHYHGNPNALFDQSGATASGVIGFAADGFPIFGSYIDDGGTVRQVSSSYRLRSGSRPVSANDPGGNYDGTYRDDYEYVAQSGDLDECNGMMRDGVYGYYVTDAYPWVLACFRGTPDTSFDKSSEGEMSGGQMGGGGMMPPPPPPG